MAILLAATAAGACLMALAALARECPALNPGRTEPNTLDLARMSRRMRVVCDHGGWVLTLTRVASLTGGRDAVALAPPLQFNVWRYYLLPRPVYAMPGTAPQRADALPAYVRRHRAFLESKGIRWVVWLNGRNRRLSRLVDVPAVLAGRPDPGVLLPDDLDSPADPTLLDYAGAAAFVALFFVLGWAFWPLAARSGGPTSWAERLPRWFALGLLVQYVVLLGPILLGVSTRWVHVGLPLAAAGAAVAARLRWRRSSPAGSARAPGLARWRLAGAVATLLCAVMVLLGAARALVMPVRNVDALNFWGLTAKVLHQEGGVRTGLYRDPDRGHTFRGYPLLVPLTLSSTYAVVGRAEDQAGKVVFPVFYAMVLLAACGAMRRERPGPGAAVVTACLACCLPYLDYTGGAASALADVPLSLFLVLGLVAWRRWATTGDRDSLAEWVLWLSAAAVTKTEGVFALVIALGAAAVVRWRVRPVAWARAGACALAVAALVAPWYLYAATLPGSVSGAPRPLLETAGANLSAWVAQMPRFLGEMLDIRRWGLLWVFAVVAVVAGWRRAAPAYRLAAGLVAAQLAAYFLAFLALPTDQAAIVATTKKRLLLHVAPSAAYLAWCFLPWAPAGLLAPADGGGADG
jgi:hypothetical protein